jgi:hypothetical protein
MLFSGKNPFEFVKRAEAGPIQVVLHPDHYTRDGAGYPEIFFGIARRFIDDLDRWYRINSTYNEKMREHLFEYVMRVGNKVQESGKHMSGRLREKAGMA